MYLLINHHFQYFTVAVSERAVVCMRDAYIRESAYDLTPAAWCMHSLPERREISPRHYAYIITSTHFVIEWLCRTYYVARWMNVAAARVILKPRLSAQ